MREGWKREERMQTICLSELGGEKKELQRRRRVCLDRGRRLEYDKVKIRGLRTVWRDRRGREGQTVEEQGRDRIAEKMEESQEREKGRIWGITGVKGVQRDERDGSDSGRSGRKFLEERLEVARMERKPEKEVRKWARQEG